ncbi:MAG: Unknown protein, partial [uncultured Sulfurovum sp.]
PDFPRISTWERRSCKLNVSNGYKKLFQVFKRGFKNEMNVLNDQSLNKELNILNTLTNSVNSMSINQNLGQPIDDWQFKN